VQKSNTFYFLPRLQHETTVAGHAYALAQNFVVENVVAGGPYVPLNGGPYVCRYRDVR